MRLDFLHQASLKGLDRHPHPLDLTAGQLDAYFLQVRAELALGTLGHVRTDAAGLLGHAAAIDDAALGGTFTRDRTDAGHKRW